jgi:hypothetical protein
VNTAYSLTPPLERKRRLRTSIPSVPTRLLYVDHVEERGTDFFEVACAHDLEGIVAKLAGGRYHADGTSTNWLKVKNPSYTQATGRHELSDAQPTINAARAGRRCSRCEPARTNFGSGRSRDDSRRMLVPSRTTPGEPPAT